MSEKKSDPFYVIRKASGAGYTPPNMENGQPLPDEKRKYMGHPLSNYDYKSETILASLNPSWQAHTIDIFW